MTPDPTRATAAHRWHEEPGGWSCACGVICRQEAAPCDQHGECKIGQRQPATAARRTSINEGGTVLTLDLQDEVDERLSGVIRHLARSGMDHDTFDNVYAPLLALRDRLMPGKYS